MRKLLISFLCLFTIHQSYSQDPFYSQFYNSPLLLNPALTGVNYGNIRIIGQYKNYLASIDPFNTFGVSLDMSIMDKDQKPNFGGIGIMLLNSSSGAGQDILLANISFSYHLDIGAKNKNFLAFGIQGGLNQTNIDFSSLSTQSQWVPGFGRDPNLGNAEPTLDERMNLIDINAGILWYAFPTEKLSWFLGAAAYHINEPEGSLTGETSTLSRRWVFHTGSRIFTSQKFAIVPNIVFMQQNSLNLFYAGLSGEYGISSQMILSLGTWLRNTDALIFGAGIEYKQFNLGLSYDTILSDLKAATSNGGIEISITYNVQKSIPNVNKFQSNPSPSF